jgi:N-acetyl-anhydromuramyl-L-alanine amidase AmpD
MSQAIVYSGRPGRQAGSRERRIQGIVAAPTSNQPRMEPKYDEGTGAHCHYCHMTEGTQWRLTTVATTVSAYPVGTACYAGVTKVQQTAKGQVHRMVAELHSNGRSGSAPGPIMVETFAAAERGDRP